MDNNIDEAVIEFKAIAEEYSLKPKVDDYIRNGRRSVSMELKWDNKDIECEVRRFNLFYNVAFFFDSLLGKYDKDYSHMMINTNKSINEVIVKFKALAKKYDLKCFVDDTTYNGNRTILMRTCWDSKGKHMNEGYPPPRPTTMKYG